MIKTCKTCAACYNIYGQGAFFYYNSVDLFYCSDRDEMTEKENVCDNWRKKNRAEVDFSEERFDEVESDILFIKNNLNHLK